MKLPRRDLLAGSLLAFNQTGGRTAEADARIDLRQELAAENGRLANKLRQFVSVADFGAVGDGVQDDTASVHAALASLSDGGVLHFENGRSYRILFGNGNDTLPDTILADRVSIEGNGARILGEPASGTIADSAYNQYFCIFKATGRSGTRIRNLHVSGALGLASLYGCTGTVIEGCSDNGLLPNPSGYLRDKSFFFWQCTDTTVANCTFDNCNFAIYLSGVDDHRTCRTSIIGCHFKQSAAAGAFTAPFPAQIYAVFADDLTISACTASDIYSSVPEGDTGVGMGYFVYEGDGACSQLRISACVARYAAKGRQRAVAVYVNEAKAAAISCDVLVEDGAQVLYGILADSKNGVCERHVHDSVLINRNRSPDSAGVAVAFNGSESGNPEGHTHSASINVVGWNSAVSVFNLGRRSKHKIDNLKARGQLQAQITLRGTPTNPICYPQINDCNLFEGQRIGLHLQGYVVSTILRDLQILDGNLSNDGDGGDLASAVLMTGGSYGLHASNCVIGNTPIGGGKFVWGVTNAEHPENRIFKDILSNNTFPGISAGAQYRRFTDATPANGLFDVNLNDFIANTGLAAGAPLGWRCVENIQAVKLVADASSASRTVSVASTSGLSAGQRVLLVKDRNPYEVDFTERFHVDVIDRVIDATRFALSNGIRPAAGTFAAETATATVARFAAAPAIET